MTENRKLRKNDMCTGFEAEKKSDHAQLLKNVETAMYQD